MREVRCLLLWESGILNSPAACANLPFVPLTALQGGRSNAGVNVPGNATLFYEVELLRCIPAPGFGLSCCAQKDYPCSVPDPESPPEVVRPTP